MRTPISAGLIRSFPLIPPKLNKETGMKITLVKPLLKNQNTRLFNKRTIAITLSMIYLRLILYRSILRRRNNITKKMMINTLTRIQSPQTPHLKNRILLIKNQETNYQTLAQSQWLIRVTKTWTIKDSQSWTAAAKCFMKYKAQIATNNSLQWRNRPVLIIWRTLHLKYPSQTLIRWWYLMTKVIVTINMGQTGQGKLKKTVQLVNRRTLLRMKWELAKISWLLSLIILATPNQEITWLTTAKVN